MQIEPAIRRFIELLGDERVRTDSGAKDQYARSSSPQGTRPAAVVFPVSTAEVQEIARIAAQFDVPLYPISRGNNWGYGDACAPGDGQVIVDLRRMNRIIEVNTELAYAVIEPGVTQQQLYEHLEKSGAPLWLDVTGAGPDASVVGNTIERGFGHSPCGDHYHMSAGYEVVLADGNVFTTGFGHYENAQAAYAFKPGIGPALDGLFTQSNLGIVTRMGVWLIQKPEYLQAFGFKVERHEDLARVVDALRPLRLSGVLQSTIHIANDLRGISASTHYPWEEMNGQTPLSAEVRTKLRRKFGLGAWNGMGGIYGTRESVRAARIAIKKAFRGITTVFFFDETLLNVAQKATAVMRKLGIFKSLQRQVASVLPVFDLLKGIPARQHLYGAGWRSKGEPVDASLNPLSNRWGLMWLSPIVPMVGRAALELESLIAPIYEKFGFEPLTTMTSITPRALCCVMTIAYDKSDPAECRRATDCYNALFEACMQRGFVPYRCGLNSMQKLDAHSQGYWAVVQQIKAALDPQNIIAPGRYLPGSARPNESEHAADSSAAERPQSAPKAHFEYAAK